MNLLLLAGAGVLAGAVNGVVGSGTLLTYPMLLAAGLPPVVANGTNSVGLAPGNAMAAWLYRDELAGRGALVRVLAATAAVGALIGAALVLALPASVFERVVPWLIVLACVLVVAQPRIGRALTARGLDPATFPRRALVPVVLVVGVYAGYFGAAQGILLMAVLATLYDVSLQRSNAVKNVLQGAANAAAAIVFIVAGVVSWPAALALGAGSLVGGSVGAPLARRLPDAVLRGVIVAVGLVAAGVSIARG